MPYCDICNKKINLFEVFYLSDGKCCQECKSKARFSVLKQRYSTVDNVVRGILQAKSFDIFSKRYETFIDEQYKKLGLVFYSRYYTENAIYTDYLDGSFMTLHNDELCFIEDGHIPYSKLSAYYMNNTDIEYAKTVAYEDLTVIRIPINKIEYYCNDGSKQFTTSVSGGGGGGSSLSGAILGGLVAGAAGAIIGSRKKINSISSSVNVHDTTKSYLTYRDNINKIVTLEFNGHDVYEYLLQKVPDKDIKMVQINNHNNTSSSSNSVTDEIRKFKELFDDGIITQEEFELKKKQLLDIQIV